MVYVMICYLGSLAVIIIFHGSGGSGKSYNLKGGCDGVQWEHYGVGVVDFYGDGEIPIERSTGQWTVTADISDCSEEFLWNWQETGGNYEAFYDPSGTGARHLPKDVLDRPYAVVYSILGEPGKAPVRKCMHVRH